ncbi:hypothetical protein ACN42_g9298 [Penicillium freii]|uniref:Uncharacterized protein n=1 Tax=Penicillium freii TaxID=48697 RepID=A0A101MCG5_PENFR|nr:hypothetical protein ACN42_g9298 [Penicillium freii]
MRPKATLPLFSSAPHSIHLFVWDSVFSFTFATIKGSQRYPSGVRERIESIFHKRLVPKLEVSLTHHLHAGGTGQGVASKLIWKKQFKCEFVELTFEKLKAVESDIL